MAFPNKTYTNGYGDEFCAGDWEKCTIAQYWNEYYEMIGDVNDREKRISKAVKSQGQHH